MDDETIHPSPDRLVAFARGEMEFAEIDVIQKHLATCDSCCRTVDRVPDDRLQSLLRQLRVSYPGVKRNTSGDAGP